MAREGIKPLERIAVKAGEGRAEFVLKRSGRPFFAKGFNYIRLRGKDGKPGGDHATFDAATKKTKVNYDPKKAEAMFGALSKEGYNTVRVFIIGRNPVNPGIGGDYKTTKAVYAPYMENFLDFLRRATRHNIRVFPTFGDGGLPLNAYYRERPIRGKGHNKNALVLTKEGVDARVKFITSFLLYIRRKEPRLLPTLLGLECQNEAYLRADAWPFTEKDGRFRAANGKAYDLSRTDERQALMDEGYRHYHKRIVSVVKRIDRDMLVAEGVFVPAAVGKDPKKHAGVWPGRTRDERYPPTLTAIGTGALDFLDVHFYHATPNPRDVPERFRRNLGSTGFFSPEMADIRKTTPVIMGEFGAFDFHEKTFAAAVDNLVRARDLANKENVNGMLFWTYDCQEQPKLYHATDDWELFVRRMGDFENAEDARSMQVTVCPRLVPDLKGGDEEAFIRRVEDLFVNKTGQWRYVSENISHFKFYSTPLVWMAKKKPELLRRVVRSIAAMKKGIAVEVGIRRGHAMTERYILDPIMKAGGRVDFVITDNVFIKSQFRKDKKGDYNWTYEQAVDKYAEYVAGIKKRYLRLKVGILEAGFRFHWEDRERFPAEVPKKDNGDLKALLVDVIKACKARGARIDMFQPEYSYERIVNTKNGWEKLRAMEEFCREEGLEFYFLFNDHTGGHDSDRLFHETVMKCLRSVKSHGLTPELGTIQSWYKHPVDDLPENRPHTFMYLAKEFIREAGRPGVR